VHAQAVLLDVVGLEREVRQVLEVPVGRAIDVDCRILLVNDGESSARPTLAALLAPSLPHKKGGAMPTYSIHHYTVAAKPDYRPRSARRIAMSARAASVAKRKSLRRAA